MTRFTNPVRGARCADRATTRVAPIAVKLTNGSRADSLPPCGGGTGWGVAPWGTVVSLGSTPTQEGRPLPSPQGGGEQSAATSNLNLAPMGATLVVARFAHRAPLTGLVKRVMPGPSPGSHRPPGTGRPQGSPLHHPYVGTNPLLSLSTMLRSLQIG